MTYSSLSCPRLTARSRALARTVDLVRPGEQVAAAAVVKRHVVRHLVVGQKPLQLAGTGGVVFEEQGQRPGRMAMDDAEQGGQFLPPAVPPPAAAEQTPRQPDAA